MHKKERCRRLRRRQPLRLDLRALPAGLRRQRVPQGAGRPVPHAGHARGHRGRGRVLRQAAARVRARRRGDLHARPGDAGAEGRPRQLHRRTASCTWRSSAIRRPARPSRPWRFGLVPEGAGGPLPRHGGARPGHPGRLEEQGSGVGLHPVGAVQADHAQARWSAGYGSPARRSDIDSPDFRSKQVINGSDLAQAVARLDRRWRPRPAT